MLSGRLGRRLQGQAGLRSREEKIEPAEREQRRPARHELGQAQEDAAEVDAAGQHGILHHAEIDAPQELRGAAQEDGQPEGGEDLREHGAAEHPADEPVVRRPAERGEPARGEGERHDGIEASQRPGKERDVHGEHEELAVGKVHQLHEPEDQRQSRGDERVEESRQDFPDRRLENDVGGQGYLRSFHVGMG